MEEETVQTLDLKALKRNMAVHVQRTQHLLKNAILKTVLLIANGRIGNMRIVLRPVEEETVHAIDLKSLKKNMEVCASGNRNTLKNAIHKIVLSIVSGRIGNMVYVLSHAEEETVQTLELKASKRIMEGCV